jgi:hypothetical protein
VSDLAGKIRDLNGKLEEIRREQQYQREREADFRDLSEATNSRAVWYIVAEILVLVVTCAWQLRHLRVRRFSSALARRSDEPPPELFRRSKISLNVRFYSILNVSNIISPRRSSLFHSSLWRCDCSCIVQITVRRPLTGSTCEHEE